MLTFLQQPTFLYAQLRMRARRSATSQCDDIPVSVRTQ
ncbi:hypothetical protein XOC_4418 [Xanthomonas oryzae pv. oryzicola BLS256]|uniref:Uncharacterized protein n=1 Tax=Xanthomonas oryzae pv. oryzicola (strain BLS256) TaxID=383407 RepID=G7TA95_XANOB|nr:hypothetical protein XOC_4418 [Xanthomonas oryzae pv. oryzicola BLS256]QEO95304.1 hypothetical protein XOCgx_0309 [Xanthomonas oryzae pv. oryzicola]